MKRNMKMLVLSLSVLKKVAISTVERKVLTLNERVDVLKQKERKVREKLP